MFFIPFFLLSFLISHNVTLGLDTFLKKWVYVFIILITVGFSIEFIQYTLIPSRSGEWLDVLSNSLGLISMLSLTYVLKKISVL